MLLLCVAAVMAVIPVVSAQEAQTIELVGAIEALSLNTITVNQQVVNTRQAQLNVQLVIGALVHVEGELVPGSGIVAREINAVMAGIQAGEAELVGILESVSGSTWMVGGQTVDVSGAEIQSQFTVRQMLRIHATAIGPNQWRAREIAAVRAGQEDNAPVPAAGEFEMIGTLESIDGTSLTVSGQAVNFTSAEIKGPLVIGTLLKLHVRLENGLLVAREVEPGRYRFSDDDEDDDDNTNANANANVNANTNANVNTNSNANVNTNVNSNTSSAAAISADQAITIVKRVYPNAVIRSIELTTRFGGTLVWEVAIGGGIELIIDAQTGVILVIDRPGSDDNSNQNGNSNDNRDDDDDDDNGSNFNDNSNSNFNNNNNFNNNSNDNSSGNDNRDDDDDDRDDDDDDD
jgi:hypothetical protein